MDNPDSEEDEDLFSAYALSPPSSVPSLVVQKCDSCPSATTSVSNQPGFLQNQGKYYTDPSNLPVNSTYDQSMAIASHRHSSPVVNNDHCSDRHSNPPFVPPPQQQQQLSQTGPYAYGFKSTQSLPLANVHGIYNDGIVPPPSYTQPQHGSFSDYGLISTHTLPSNDGQYIHINNNSPSPSPSHSNSYYQPNTNSLYLDTNLKNEFRPSHSSSEYSPFHPDRRTVSNPTLIGFENHIDNKNISSNDNGKAVDSNYQFTSPQYDSHFSKIDGNDNNFKNDNVATKSSNPPINIQISASTSNTNNRIKKGIPIKPIPYSPTPKPTSSSPTPPPKPPAYGQAPPKPMPYSPTPPQPTPYSPTPSEARKRDDSKMKKRLSEPSLGTKPPPRPTSGPRSSPMTRNAKSTSELNLDSISPIYSPSTSRTSSPCVSPAPSRPVSRPVSRPASRPTSPSASRPASPPYSPPLIHLPFESYSQPPGPSLSSNDISCELKRTETSFTVSMYPTVLSEDEFISEDDDEFENDKITETPTEIVDQASMESLPRPLSSEVKRLSLSVSDRPMHYYEKEFPSGNFEDLYAFDSEEESDSGQYVYDDETIEIEEYSKTMISTNVVPRNSITPPPRPDKQPNWSRPPVYEKPLMGRPIKRTRSVPETRNKTEVCVMGMSSLSVNQEALALDTANSPRDTLSLRSYLSHYEKIRHRYEHLNEVAPETALPAYKALCQAYDAYKCVQALSGENLSIKHELESTEHQWSKSKNVKPRFCNVCAEMITVQNCAKCSVCKRKCHVDCQKIALPCFGMGGARGFSGRFHGFVSFIFVQPLRCMQCRKMIGVLSGVAKKCLNCGFVSHFQCCSNVPPNCVAIDLLQEHRPSTIGNTLSKDGYNAHVPILLVPGFASSGLQIIKSDTKPKWKGSRVWLSVQKLGINMFKNVNNAGSSIEESKQRNEWIRHMSLENGWEDPQGIVVRPLEGIEAVDFLEPGAFTNAASYVFGPVIENLRYVGYTDQNLLAAPYDWRLTPSKLEERDGYFSDLIKMVELLYEQNDDTPVCLVGHSMGVINAKYFLHFVNLKRGRAWIDKHIHSFFAAGGPFLGAPKSYRSMYSGDDFGLGTFLNSTEATMLCRSFGSAGFLFPRGMVHSQTRFFVRSTGHYVLTLTTFTWERKSLATEIYFNISGSRKKKMKTAPVSSTSMIVEMNQSFQFSSQDQTAPQSGECFSFELFERKAILHNFLGQGEQLGSRKDSGDIEIATKTGFLLGKLGFNLHFVPSDNSSSDTRLKYSSRTSEEFFSECHVAEVFKRNCLVENDPLYGPFIEKPPPVNKLHLCYGINIPTEVSYGYRRKTTRLEETVPKFKLDARINVPGYSCKDGIIYETKKTPQKQLDTNEVIKICGDGTVPYTSLRFPMTWQGMDNLQIECSEVAGLPHREMLAADSFNEILIKHVCLQIVPPEEEWEKI